MNLKLLWLAIFSSVFLYEIECKNNYRLLRGSYGSSMYSSMEKIQKQKPAKTRDYGERYNAYFKDGRTYSKLYVYYRPDNFYWEIGYYSLVYKDTYYDGYGYNFYYGVYGYYENSRNDESFLGIFLLIGGTLLCFYGVIFGCYFYGKY